MTTARKKAGPPGGIGSPEYKAAQEGKNKAMAAALAALPMAKRTRGRPVTTGTTPAKDRKAKERATATEQGGGRLHVMLTAEGARHLRAIMEDRGLNKTEAVDFALARGNGC